MAQIEPLYPPLIYNGQEVGFNRRLEFFEKDNIDWLVSGSEHELAGLYEQLNAFKKSNPALFTQEKDGEMVEIENNVPEKVWSFKRVKGENEVHCLFNFSEEGVVVAFNEVIAGSGFKDFHNNATSESIESVELKPWEYKLYYKK